MCDNSRRSGASWVRNWEEGTGEGGIAGSWCSFTRARASSSQGGISRGDGVRASCQGGRGCQAERDHDHDHEGGSLEGS